MPKEETVFSFRLPTELYERLRRLAELDERSINAEMIVAIRRFVVDGERKHNIIALDKPDD